LKGKVIALLLNREEVEASTLKRITSIEEQLQIFESNN